MSRLRYTHDEHPASADAVVVLRQFRQIFNAVKSHFRQVEKEVGLGGAQLWALGEVQRQPGMGTGELAQALNIRLSTASNLVKALVERGLLQTSRKPADKRAVALQLSPEGEQLLQRSPGPFTGVLPEALRSLDEASLQALRQHLGELIAVLQADESGGDVLLADL